MRTISYETFLDKVWGCWYGKCLGGAAGAPTEGLKKLVPVEDFTTIYNPDLPNDDLDLQLLFLDVLEKKGPLISSDDLADAWIARCWYPFSEYGYFMKNYMRGVKPPYTGLINNSFFKEGMGCPIRSELWGIISVGNPELAAQYAYMDGTLDHADNSVWAEQFLAAMAAEAFFEPDILKLVDKAMAFVPAESKLGRCFRDVLEAFRAGTPWKQTRQLVLNRYSHPDFTNVTQNLGFVLLSMLYGGGDMIKTINIALQCGYDTDCTCGSAAAIIGILQGYRGLGGETTGLINDYYVCGVDVVRRSDKISDLAEDTCAMAMRTPNYAVEITGSPVPADRPAGFAGFTLRTVTAEGLSAELTKLEPARWTVWGPWFEQLEQPMDPRYPSPHGEGCVLPDIVCMVNSQVSLDKDYPLGDPACVVPAYEDLIDIDGHLTMEGQMCCYAETTVWAKADMQAWILIGNSDGFRLTVNGEPVLEKDEIRYWTPYNNFTLVNLKEGPNTIGLKLLRRTEHLKISLGLRIYNGSHWHRSKWHTDQISWTKPE